MRHMVQVTEAFRPLVAPEPLVDYAGPRPVVTDNIDPQPPRPIEPEYITTPLSPPTSEIIDGAGGVTIGAVEEPFVPGPIQFASQDIDFFNGLDDEFLARFASVAPSRRPTDAVGRATGCLREREEKGDAVIRR